MKEDEDWKPDSPPEVVKKAATAKKAKNSPVVRGGPYNHRHHNPDIAHLGVPVEGSIRHLLLSQVALSTRIITWLHVRSLFLTLLRPFLASPLFFLSIDLPSSVY